MSALAGGVAARIAKAKQISAKRCIISP
jgi:hypothetical protein